MAGATSTLVRALAAFVVTGLVAMPAAEAETRKSAAQVLQSLPVAPENPAGYDRDLFPHWTSGAGGCSTRELVLVAERVQGTPRGCTVAGGTWRSAYDGVRTANPSRFDIDHMVPLKEAWDSGAWRWTTGTRQAFANDLGYAQSLIAVSAGSNRSKSDRDPAQWLPELARCAYAKAWVGVKYRWRLSVDAAEKAALSRVLSRCSTGMVVPALAPRQVDASATSPGSPDRGSSSGSSGRTDPRFDTCSAANAAGYGPYTRGQDPEYAWYIDRDGDGRACEP